MGKVCHRTLCLMGNGSHGKQCLMGSYEILIGEVASHGKQFSKEPTRDLSKRKPFYVNRILRARQGFAWAVGRVVRGAGGWFGYSAGRAA